MNEVLLALLSFGLGILATITTQFISRRVQYSDARRKQRLENLKRIKQWMEAYRALFHCKYPDMYEFVFGFETMPEMPLYDETAPRRLYDALKEYKDAKKKYEEAKRLGRESMFLLAERRLFDRFLLFWALILKRKPNLYVYLYPPGFPRAIAPYLEVLDEQYSRVFVQFPEKVARRIDWDMLEYIEPSRVEDVIHRRLRPRGNLRLPGEEDREYLEKQIELGEARDGLAYCKQKAENAIDNVLEVIRSYENKWFTPYGNP